MAAMRWPLFLFVLSLTAFGDLAGTGYEPGSNHTKKIFTFKSIRTGDAANYGVSSQFISLEGAPLVTEALTVKNGQVERYEVKHSAPMEEGFLEIRDGQIHFTYRKDGKTASSSETVPKDLVVAPQLLSFIESRWEPLMAGETVNFRFAVLERQETIGFKVFKDEMKDGTVIFKMKPSNFLISAMVSPVKIIYSSQDKAIMEIKGRTLPKKNENGKWKDQEPEIVYERAMKS